MAQSADVFAHKYWVFLKQRDFTKINVISKDCERNRAMLKLPIYQENDFGPSADDIEKLKSIGVSICNVSRWFNAVSVSSNNLQKTQILALNGVLGIREIESYELAKIQSENFQLTETLSQLKAQFFIQKNIHAQDIKIGVIDGGFYNAPKESGLNHIKIVNTKDFNLPVRQDFFNEKRSNLDVHGTMVLQYLGGYFPENEAYAGLASKAQYYLASTESSLRESRVEEDNWVAAIEWLDSLGVRLVNSSLGYSTGFTNPSENYTPEQMNGHSSIIAAGASMAVSKKGMVVVVSAGNEGENIKWGGIIGTPADAQEVISVGANDQYGLKMPYSSKGPEFLEYLKPEISTWSKYGTSFASPTLVGVVACMMQIDPTLTAADVKNLLCKSSKLFPFPNNYVGYGYPDAEKLIKLLDNSNLSFGSKIKIIKAKKQLKIKNLNQEPIIVFHKKDKLNVISQINLYAKDGVCVIPQVEGAVFTSIITNSKNYEIKWK